MSMTLRRSSTYGIQKSSSRTTSLRARQRDAFHTGVACTKERVRAILDPARDVGIGGAAVRRVVLEAAVFRRVVRRRDDDAVGEALGATAVVDQNRARDHGRRRVSVVGLDDGVDTVRSEDLERRALRRRRHRVRILAHVQGSARSLRAPKIADRLRNRQDVHLGERAVERRPAVSTGAETHTLARIRRIGRARVVLALEPRRIDKHFLGSRLTGERRQGHGRHAIEQGTAHMPDLRRILRNGTSLENLPETATLRMLLRARDIKDVPNRVALRLERRRTAGAQRSLLVWNGY